jgi:hypothetical protein
LTAFEVARQRYGRKENVETLPATSQKQKALQQSPVTTSLGDVVYEPDTD